MDAAAVARARRASERGSRDHLRCGGEHGGDRDARGRCAAAQGPRRARSTVVRVGTKSEGRCELGRFTGIGAGIIPWCMTHGILPMQPNNSHDPAFATRNTRRRKTRRETRARAAAAEGAANAPLADSHRRPRESLDCVPRDPGPSGPSLPARPLARPGVADSVGRRPVLVVSPWSLRVRTARPRTAPRRALAPATLPPIPRGWWPSATGPAPPQPPPSAWTSPSSSSSSSCARATGASPSTRSATSRRRS